MKFAEFLTLQEDFMKFNMASVRGTDDNLEVHVNRDKVDRVAKFLDKKKVSYFKKSEGYGSFALKIKSSMKFDDLKKLIIEFEKDHNSFI